MQNWEWMRERGTAKRLEPSRPQEAQEYIILDGTGKTDSWPEDARIQQLAKQGKAASESSERHASALQGRDLEV